VSRRLQIGVYVMAPPNRGPAARQLAGGEADISVNVAATSDLRDVAVHAENLGFDAFWLPDHVVMPTRYASRYPYQTNPDGDFLPYPFDATAFPEPFTALAFIAGATHRIRLGTGVLILPERNPVLFAKQAATLDSLSDGRLQLGVGIGWLREEFDALGVEWRDRGRRTDESIQAMRALWTDEIASFHGEFVDFQDVRCDPKPVQPGGVPLIIGGHSEAAARRAGRLGDGFMPVGFGGQHDVAPLVAEMRASAHDAGRDPDRIELYSGAAPDPAALDQLAASGVRHVFIAGFPTDRDAAMHWLDDVAASVLIDR
jgi:probable F420-dependent oxidoreductase